MILTDVSIGSKKCNSVAACQAYELLLAQRDSRPCGAEMLILSKPDWPALGRQEESLFTLLHC